MRDLINIIEHAQGCIAETLFYRENVYGREVRIYRNPTPREFSSLIEQSEWGRLRGMVSPTELFVWDAGLSDHQPIMNLGIDGERIEIADEGEMLNCANCMSSRHQRRNFIIRSWSIPMMEEEINGPKDIHTFSKLWKELPVTLLPTDLNCDAHTCYSIWTMAYLTNPPTLNVKTAKIKAYFTLSVGWLSA